MTMMIITMVRKTHTMLSKFYCWQFLDWQFDSLAMSEEPTPVVASKPAPPSGVHPVQRKLGQAPVNGSRSLKAAVVRPSPLRSMMSASWVEDSKMRRAWSSTTVYISNWSYIDFTVSFRTTIPHGQSWHVDGCWQGYVLRWRRRPTNNPTALSVSTFAQLWRLRATFKALLPGC